MTYTYRHTVRACYTGAFTQAINNNLAPLLFTIFQDQFGLSFEQVGRLILLNFGVQIAADLFSVRYADRLGHRRAMVISHACCAAGLVLLCVLPNVLEHPYWGLMAAVALYAVGGGLLEVLVSPIVDALPGDEKSKAMSLLHSFYCWGQVCVVLITTVLLRLLGSAMWPLLPLLWAIVPLYNLFFFLKVPLVPPLPAEKRMPVRGLLRSKFFIVALVLMLCAGASELTMSQWSSLFAERGLGVPKMLGDLLGPCLFAVLMGAGRAFYGFKGEKLNLKTVLILCGGGCLACYLITVFSPLPLLSLAGCALCGLTVSLMWPGTFSLTSEKFPTGGTAMFGMMAVFGDLGGSLGPWLAGFISDAAQRTNLLHTLEQSTGEALSQLGLKSGLLLSALFPAVLLGGVLYFKYGREQREDAL